MKVIMYNRQPAVQISETEFRYLSPIELVGHIQDLEKKLEQTSLERNSKLDDRTEKGILVLEAVESWKEKHPVYAEESIIQSDDVMLSLPELAAGVLNIVGYSIFDDRTAGETPAPKKGKKS